MSDKETIEKITADHAKRLIEQGRFSDAQVVLHAGQRLSAHLDSEASDKTT